MLPLGEKIMIPTRRFWWLLALGIPLSAIAAQFGFENFWFIYDVILLGLAYATSRLVPNPNNLKLSRRYDAVLSVRVPNKIDIHLHNDGSWPIQAVLRDEPPPYWQATHQENKIDLKPGQESVLHYSVIPEERGSDSFRGTYLRLNCPFGLATRQVRLATEEPIRVYPNVLALAEFDFLNQKGRLNQMGVRKSRRRGMGTEFESLRDYSDGDDFRKVDWNASARRNKLVVRQYEQERNQVVWIVIDVGRYMLSEVSGVRKLDRALDAALMLAHAVARQGDLIGLLVYGATVIRYIPPRKGKAQLGMVLEAIHDLIATPLEPDPIAASSYLSARWKRRSLMVVFTDAEDEDAARDLASAWAPVSRRHLMVMARVMDTKLREISKSPYENVKSIYRRTAAEMLINERRKSGQILSSAGIQSLEADPNQLNSALINFYFSVKERSLL